MENSKNSINTNDIQKVNEYAEAVNKLKEAVNGVNSKLPEFADGMKTGLKALGEKLPEVVDAMIKLNSQNKELAASGQKPVGVFGQLISAMGSWNGLISVGVTLLATYGGAIIDWVGNMIKGQTTLTVLGKTMKDNAIVAEALIQTKLKGAQAAQREITELNVLYRTSQNHNLSLNYRKQIIEQLKSQWPQTFKNLSDEAILTAKAANAYKSLKEQIMASALAEAAKNQITANASRILENQLKIEKEKANNLKIQNELKDADNQEANLNKNTYMNEGAGGESLFYLIKRHFINNRKEESDKKSADLKTDIELLNAQNAQYNKTIDEQYKKIASLTKNAPQLNNNAFPKNPTADFHKQEADQAQQELTDSIAREAELRLSGFAKEVQQTNDHFDQLKQQYKGNDVACEQLEKERRATLAQISDKFQSDDLTKLDEYEKQLQKIQRDAGKSAEELAIQQLKDEYQAKTDEIDNEQKAAEVNRTNIENLQRELKNKGRNSEVEDLQAALNKELAIIEKANSVKKQLLNQQNIDEQKLRDDFAKKAEESKKKALENQKNKAKQDEQSKESKQQNLINQSQQSGEDYKAFQLQKKLLDMQKAYAIQNVTETNKTVKQIDDEYVKKKIDLETQFVESKIQAGNKFLNSVLQNSNKESAIYKAAFLAKKATSVADTIISTRRAVLDSLKAYSDIPFIGQALGIAQAAFMAAQGAMSIAEITKQKPGFASGGQFISDGRGAVLSGYSRTDNTNAYLRSGEAVVVSEAMRNPWARNLVSAVNVAFGGRDFSVTNPGRGYAIGGIFTDGGNANRYYSQPMNDVKDLANTLAYQMINNFPPVYVDVKDINSQQNILAQTVNRVNL